MMASEKSDSAFDVLRNRHFLFLWLAQALSQTAQNAVFYALLVFVEENTHSTIHVSALILSAIVPSVIFGIAAGVFVDRARKKTVLVVTNLLRGFVIVGFLVFPKAFVLMYALNFIFSTVSQFFGPAEAAAIPLLVKRKQLVAANGFFNLTFSASQMAGFVLIAPPLIKWFGVPTLLIGIIITYGICALLVSTLPSGEPSHKPLSDLSRSTLFSSLKLELRDGWALLTGDKLISLAMVQLTLAATLMLVMGMLAPGFVNRILGIRADDAVYIFAPAGIGILLGTLLLPRLADRYGKATLASLGLLAMATSLAALAIAPGGGRFLMTSVVPRLIDPADLPHAISLVTAVMSLSLVIGLTFTFINIPAQTTLQERAPVYMRGRIFAIQLTFGNLASILPLVFLGALADVVGILTVLLVIAFGVLMVGFYSYSEAKKTIPMGPPEEALTGPDPS